MKAMRLAVAVCGMLGQVAAVHAGEFRVTSQAYGDGVIKFSQFADAFGCKGENQSPDISWSGAPAGTRSFVVTIYDKDAPTGSGFWHWQVVDIPADVTSLAAGAGSDPAKLPKGAHMGMNDAGQSAFLGACPPAGQTHDYRLTVKALGIEKLPLPQPATGALIGFVANANTLAEASLTAKGSN